MSEVNKIIEIKQQLSSPDNFRNDLNELMATAMQHFEKKYISPINRAIQDNKHYYAAHPSREVNLLNALRPYLDNGNSIDKIVDILNTARLFKDISAIKTGDASNNVITAAAIEDSAVHSDGIYELDEGCINTNAQGTPAKKPLTPMIFLLIALFAINE